MSQGLGTRSAIFERFPRVSRDEPYGEYVISTVASFSPRERG